MKGNLRGRNNSKCYSASDYLKILNQDQSYRSVKIEKSRRVVESRPVCLGLNTTNNIELIQRFINLFLSLKSV
jgi:hypothetical protein